MSEETLSGPVPLFRVAKGRPSTAETAALTVVLVAARAARARAARARAARARADRASGSGAQRHWASHQRALGIPLAPGPHTWRRSAR
jgi:hypothetical protein